MFLTLTGCGAESKSTSSAANFDWHEFAGTWTAAGNRYSINFGPDRRPSIANLTGSLLLAGPARPGVGFQSEVVVLNAQGGSQNVIFVGSGYLTQRELYRLGLWTTLFFLAVFLVIGTGWIILVTRI